MIAFWDIVPCSLIEIDVSEVRTASITMAIVLMMNQYAPLKRRSTSMRLHGTFPQKSVIFIRIFCSCSTDADV
jgi:hypothetical protein